MENCFGTTSTVPGVPTNPAFADELIRRALSHAVAIRSNSKPYDDSVGAASRHNCGDAAPTRPNATQCKCWRRLGRC